MADRYQSVPEKFVRKKTITDKVTGLDYVLEFPEQESSEKNPKNCNVTSYKDNKLLTFSVCKTKTYIPTNKELFGDVQTFYVGDNIIVREDSWASDESKLRYTVYEPEKLDLVKILLNKDVIGFKSLVEPKEEKLRSLEVGYTTDDFYVDSHLLNTTGIMREIVTLIKPHFDACFPPDKTIDVYVGFPFSGLGFSQELVYMRNAEIETNNKENNKRREPSRLLTIAKDNTRKIKITKPEDLKGILRTGDIVLFPDDVFGRGTTICHTYTKFNDAEFLKTITPPVEQVYVIGYYTILDLQRKEDKDDDFKKDVVDKKIKDKIKKVNEELKAKNETNEKMHKDFNGYSFITIENIVDILFAKNNSLFASRKYNLEDIEKVKRLAEDYLTAPCNCEKGKEYRIDDA